MRLQEQINALLTIDQCEWFFWHMHELASEEMWTTNNQAKEESVKILKEKYGYSDGDIKSGIEWLKKICKAMERTIK